MIGGKGHARWRKTIFGKLLGRTNGHTEGKIIPETEPSPEPLIVTEADLPSFCERVEALGGHHNPECAKAMRGLVYQPTTQIDLSLDPFSEDYFNQQISLYEELSGRAFDIKEGEQYAIDVEARINTANPYASPNSHFISMHAKAVMAALEAAELPLRPKILDLGCGWGLSSELLAFAGAKVTTLDINPLFCDLVSRRARRLGLPIRAISGTFDTFDPQDDGYDYAFFYECLHHAPRPLDTLNHVAKFLKPRGVIAFAGEPLNAPFWPEWGLRLDFRSVYVIRTHGWFESGCTGKFLSQCFHRAGFKLQVIPKIGLRGGPVGIARRS